MRAIRKDVRLNGITIVVFFREDGQVSLDCGISWTTPSEAATIVSAKCDHNLVFKKIASASKNIDWGAEFTRLTRDDEPTEFQRLFENPPLE